MNKSITVILLLFLLPFAGESQGTFHFSDTSFVLGQKRCLNLRYALGGDYQLVTDSMSIAELDSLVHFLNQNKQFTIEIGVHTDSRGSDSMNLKLSQWRAESIKNYLLKQGISESRMIAKGYGETSWIVPEEEINKYKKIDKRMYEKLHQMNRRMEIRIVGV